MGGSITAGMGLFDWVRSVVNDHDETVHRELDACDESRKKYTFTGILETLLNEHFPCVAEAPPATATGQTWRGAGGKVAGGGGGSNASAGPLVFTEAQRSGRHIVENLGRQGTGTNYWMQEMARWKNSRRRELTDPFAYGVDLVRRPTIDNLTSCAHAPSPSRPAADRRLRLELTCGACAGDCGFRRERHGRSGESHGHA